MNPYKLFMAAVATISVVGALISLIRLISHERDIAQAKGSLLAMAKRNVSENTTYLN